MLEILGEMWNIGSRPCKIMEVLNLLEAEISDYTSKELQTFVGDCLLTGLCHKTPDL